jgi:hypothetical protein
MAIFFSKKAFDELSARVEKLELQAKQLDMEWSSTYDKFRSILARIAKRSERAASYDSDAESQGTGNLTATESGPLSKLTARQHTLQSQILSRRRQ